MGVFKSHVNEPTARKYTKALKPHMLKAADRGKDREPSLDDLSITSENPPPGHDQPKRKKFSIHLHPHSRDLKDKEEDDSNTKKIKPKKSQRKLSIMSTLSTDFSKLDDAHLPKFETIRRNETWFQFKRRIRSDLNGALQDFRHQEDETLIIERKQKKKDKLNRNDKHTSRSEISGENDNLDEDDRIMDFKELPRDLVSFGEQAQRPPIFKSIPRGAEKIDHQKVIQSMKDNQEEDYLFRHQQKKKRIALLSSDHKPIVASKRTIPTAITDDKMESTKTEKQALELLKQRIAAQHRLKRAQILLDKKKMSSTSRHRHSNKKNAGSYLNLDEFELEELAKIRPCLNRKSKK